MSYTLFSKKSTTTPETPALFTLEAFKLLQPNEDAGSFQVLRGQETLSVWIAPEDVSLALPNTDLRGHFFTSEGQLWVDQLWPRRPEEEAIMEAFVQNITKKNLRPGQKVPNFPFYDSEGTFVDLQHFLGKTLVLSFFFTRCSVPEMCPATLRHFLELQKELQAKPSDTHLLLVTLDPDYDTPGLLHPFAAQRGFDPQYTSLLSTPTPILTHLCRSLGQGFRKHKGTLIHNVVRVTIDKEGCLQKKG